MIKCRHRKSNFVTRWAFAFMLAGVIAMVLSAQAWSESKAIYYKNRQGQCFQKHQDNTLIPLEIALDQQPKQRTHQKNLPYEDQEALIKKYKKWKALPPEKQNMMRQRMQQWNKLPPEKRQLYQQRFHQWEQLSPHERRSIREKLEKWNRLSPAEKEKIRQRFRNE
jgi:Skp family chaperone for outer membrane proteins